MEIADSARKHDVELVDINHALRHAVRTSLQTDDDTGEVRQLVIGPATDGILLEIVVVRPYTDDETVIHAMPARPKFL